MRTVKDSVKTFAKSKRRVTLCLLVSAMTMLFSSLPELMQISLLLLAFLSASIFLERLLFGSAQTHFVSLQEQRFGAKFC
ncbi:hypothetical protein CS022_08040 [Veronia nyctiphanis]|uniref:Uncharacterized protein n=1 Tax=Veronia nyctiphanis TaxID=1278244 RepID=A0A4Q0YX91_9GAMM|nr:hypothetical protein [Veronia nyctiphanis]RXJ73681.1 hypothetical protein CS022_08040 [Veronia nyctiphanis]